MDIQALSLFKAISPIGIILSNVILLAVTLTVWLKKGKPLLKPDKEKIKETVRRILNSFKLDKGLLVLFTGVLFMLTGAFLLCAFLPINEPDALTYHTYRALVWAEKGYVYHFETADIRNLVMPINSELIYTWIFALTKKDFGFGFLEFSSYIFCLIGIWAFLDRLKISIRKRLWAILIFSSFAWVISQISSTQTDLTVGTLLLYSLIFFINYIKEKGRTKGVMSSLAFALALGVKSTAFVAGLPLLIMFLVYTVVKKQVKKYILYIGFLALNFAIFSSYNYVLNFIDFSNPLGSEISLNMHSFYGGIKGFIANFIRYNIQMFDFAGFEWGIYLNETVSKVQGAIFSFLHIPVDTGVLIPMEGLNFSLSEQITGLGVTGILTFLPCSAISLFLFLKSGIRKIKERRLLLYVLGAVYYLSLTVLSFTVGYMVFSVRFIGTFATLGSPLLVLCYFKKNNFYKGLVILFAAFYLFIVSGQLAIRPLYGLAKAYGAERNFSKFANRVRCMEYKCFEGYQLSCKLGEAIFPYIKENKKAAIFGNKSFYMQTVKIYAAQKNIAIDELLASRVKDYDLNKYDYIITPYPSQAIDVFNNKDKKAVEDGSYPKQCYFEKDLYSKRVAKIECAMPYKEIENKGFMAVYNLRIGWKDVDDKQQYSQYIIWRKF